MLFSKALSLFALSATAVQAIPEPLVENAQAINLNASVTAVTNAFTTVLVGLDKTAIANTAVIRALLSTLLASGEEDATATAAALATILGQTSAYAAALETVLAELEICVGGST